MDKVDIDLELSIMGQMDALLDELPMEAKERALSWLMKKQADKILGTARELKQAADKLKEEAGKLREEKMK